MRCRGQRECKQCYGDVDDDDGITHTDPDAVETQHTSFGFEILKINQKNIFCLTELFIDCSIACLLIDRVIYSFFFIGNVLCI